MATLTIEELAAFLKQATGAPFEVAPADRVKGSRKRLFVGLSAPALEILGKGPLAGMQDQEHVVRNVDSDVFLYGQGPHGNLYAVYDFLETSVGCRWYSAFGGMKNHLYSSICVHLGHPTTPLSAYCFVGTSLARLASRSLGEGWERGRLLSGFLFPGYGCIGRF